MKKVLYGIFAITALAATSVYAAPVQVGEAARLSSNVCLRGEFYRDGDKHRRLGRGCRSGGNRWR